MPGDASPVNHFDEKFSIKSETKVIFLRLACLGQLFIFLGVTLPDERVLTQITIVKDQKWGPMNDTASSVGSDQNAESAPSLH